MEQFSFKSSYMKSVTLFKRTIVVIDVYKRQPFDGTVSRNLVDAGGYVGGSVQPVTLATIYKDDHLYTYFNVADNQWRSMLMQQGDVYKRQG